MSDEERDDISEEAGDGLPGSQPEAEDAAADGGDPDGDPDGDPEGEPAIRLAKVTDGDPGLPEEVLLSRIESLVFAFPEPITVRRLSRLLSLEGRRVRELLDRIAADYAGRGIILSEISGGFQFQTHPDNAAVVREALKVKPMRMSRPAIETLAIVAYRQPVTRADVEDVRRVDCGGTLKFLFEKGLIRVLGRKEEPGRPILYGTSQEFLELFGLKALADLPSLREFTELWDEHQELVDELDAEAEIDRDPGREPGEPGEPAPEAPASGEDPDAEGSGEGLPAEPEEEEP
jgi:segregation and condensation protein B